MTDTPNPESTVAPQPQKPPLDLVALYPACFDWKRPRPLKIGIRDDLVAAGHDPTLIRRALGKYCSVRSYLKATQAGTPRIDLQGQPVGAVTADEEAMAKAKLASNSTKKTKPKKQNLLIKASKIKKASKRKSNISASQDRVGKAVELGTVCKRSREPEGYSGKGGSIWTFSGGLPSLGKKSR